MIEFLKRFLLFLVGFTLPLQGVAVGALGLHMTAFKASTALLLALGSLYFAMGVRRRRTVVDRKIPWVVLLGVAFLIAAVNGSIQGVEKSVLVADTVTRSALLLYYLGIGYVVFTRTDLTALLWGLVIGGATTAVPAALGPEPTSQLERSQGLAGQSNVLGYDMCVVLPVVLALFIVSRSRIAKMALLGAGALTLGGLLLSLSRTAFVAGLSMGGFWTYRFRRVGSLKYALLAIPLLVVVVLMAPQAVTDRFNTMIDPSERARDESIQGRLTNLEWGTRAFFSSPIVGLGRFTYADWVREQGGPLSVGQIHTGHLRVAADQGLMGFIPYVVILVLSWLQYDKAWRLVRARRFLRDPFLMEMGMFALVLQMALFGTLVAGLTTHTEMFKTAWLVLALSPVVLNLVAQRVNELQAEQTAEEGEESPLPAAGRPAPAPVSYST